MRAAVGLGGVAVLLLVVAGFVLWVWTLVDAIRTPDARFQAGNQLVWVIVIVFTNIIGSLIYLAIGRPTTARS